MIKRQTLRRILLNTHLVVALGFALLLIPISITGAALTIQDVLEPWIYPARFGHTEQRKLPLEDYINAAQTSFGESVRVASMRLPERSDGAIAVSGRSAPAPQARRERDDNGQQAASRGAGEGRRQGERANAPRQADAGPAPGAGGPPRFLTAYLDPADGRVIEVVDFRQSMFGWMHVFHENLQIGQYGGRSIVGWCGVAMLLLSLSGIYLWWPRNGAFLKGMRWKRHPTTMSNLHHTFGFWISIPLAVVSLTGIYLGFPQQARQLLGTFTELTPRPAFGRPAPSQGRLLKADDAAALALASAPAGSTVRSINLPGQAGPTLWRVQLVSTATDDAIDLSVDDKSREVTPNQAGTKSGDRIQQMIRWLHEGSHLGSFWKFLVFLTGVFPPIFAVTGVIMWLRRRRLEQKMKHLKAGAAPLRSQPAE